MEPFICALDLYNNCRIEHSQELQRGDLLDMDKVVSRVANLFFAQLAVDEEKYGADPQAQQTVQQMFRQISKCVDMLNENFKGYVLDEYTHQLDTQYKSLVGQMGRHVVTQEQFKSFSDCAQTIQDIIAQIGQRDKFS